MCYPLVNKQFDPEHHPFLMETSQLEPDDCQGRTVNLPEGMFTLKKAPRI